MSILEPVRRGLVGYYDARAYWHTTGTPIEEIADLSGNLNNMKQLNLASLWEEESRFPHIINNNVFGDWPAFRGTGTFGQSSYGARWTWPKEPTELTVCVLCQVRERIGLNSTVPISFGYYGFDAYFGPLAGGFVDEPPQWTGPFLLHPFGKLINWDVIPLPITRIVISAAIGGTMFFRQDGALQEEVDTIYTSFAYNQLEMARGNPYSDVGIALFYNVQLTPEECEQNEQFMDWTTSESLPHMFQQPRGGELP